MTVGIYIQISTEEQAKEELLYEVFVFELLILIPAS